MLPHGGGKRQTQGARKELYLPWLNMILLLASSPITSRGGHRREPSGDLKAVDLCWALNPCHFGYWPIHDLELWAQRKPSLPGLRTFFLSVSTNLGEWGCPVTCCSLVLWLFCPLEGSVVLLLWLGS
jgi:hypothetical protein